MSRAGEKETGWERTFVQLSGVSSHTRVHIQTRSILQAHKFTLPPGRADGNVNTSHGPAFYDLHIRSPLRTHVTGFHLNFYLCNSCFPPHMYSTVYICAAFGLSDYNQDVVRIRNWRSQHPNYRPVVSADRKRGVILKEDGDKRGGHVRRVKKSWWIQFHTNWNKYKAIYCNHPLGTISSTGFTPCAFPPGMPPNCYYQMKTSGFTGSELGQNSHTKVGGGGGGVLCTQRAHALPFMRALSVAVTKPRPHPRLLYSQLMQTRTGVDVNSLERRSIRCSDPRKSLSARRHAVQVAPASQSIVSSWPLAWVSPFREEGGQP